MDDDPDGVQGVEAHLERFSGCEGGVEVRLYGIQGGSHIWPTFGVESLAMDFLQPFSR